MRLRWLPEVCLLAWSFGSSAAAEIGPGHPDLDPDRLPLGSVKIASVKIADGVQTPLNTTEQTIEPLRGNGEDVLRIASIHASAQGDTTFGEILVRASDLSLLHHRVRASGDSMSVSFGGRHVTGWVVLPDRPVQLLDVEVVGPVLPVDGPMPWLVCALPLGTGYRADVARFSPWIGRIQIQPIEVRGEESVEVDGETIPCWKVDLGPLGPPGYRATVWVHPSSRWILQSALEGPPGEPRYRSAVVSIEPLEDRDPPVTIEDVRILVRAGEILSSPQVWDQQDDRECHDEDEAFSLFCALQRACVEVLGQYEHRRAALQEVRFAIEEVSGGRQFEHRLRDFNNTSSFEDVRRVLQIALEALHRRLKGP